MSNLEICTVADPETTHNTQSGLSHYIEAAQMLLLLLKYIIGFGGGKIETRKE